MNPTLSPDEKFNRELYQQAHAIYAVCNPTDTDYQLIFDRRVHVIPNQTKDFGKGKGIEYLSAYLAKKYATEMTNKLLQAKGMKLVSEENERRREAGMALLTKYPSDNPQQVVEEQINVNDPKVRAEVMKTLIKGLVQKAPEDIMLAQAEEKKDNTTPVDEQIFNSFENLTYTPETVSYQTPTAAVHMTEPAIQAAKEHLITNLEQQHNAPQEETL